MRRHLLTLATSLAAMTAAAAQAAEPAFVDCKMTDGRRVIYRISADNWSSWNADRWKWLDFKPCYRPSRTYTGPCDIEISDLEYRFVDEIDWGRMKNRAVYSIFRASGKYTYTFTDDDLKKSRKEEGVCAKTRDPSQEPKPVPAM